MSENCVGVILAAGKGSRMAPFGDTWPKPILPVGNRPLIAHHLESMKSVGIREIVVLVGHKGFEISKVIGDGAAWGVRVRYVEQTSSLGIAHAVGCLERHIQQPFLLFLGDIYFRHVGLQPMFDRLRAQGGGAVLGVKEEQSFEAIRRNFSVQLGEDGRVTRVVEKPRIVQNRLKGVGIYLFDLPIFDAIRQTPRTAMRDEYEITHSIQIMIDEGYRVSALPIVDDDINLTYPADLLRCNLELARLAPEGKLVGENVRIHPQAEIVNSVIGSNVIIENPIRITQSLVFGGTRVVTTSNLDRQIAALEGMVDCRADDVGR